LVKVVLPLSAVLTMTTREKFWRPSMMRHRVAPLSTNGPFSLSSEVVVRSRLAHTTMATRCWCIWHQMMEQSTISQQCQLVNRHRMTNCLLPRDVLRK
jgi:hypothetical protein